MSPGLSPSDYFSSMRWPFADVPFACYRQRRWVVLSLLAGFSMVGAKTIVKVTTTPTNVHPRSWQSPSRSVLRLTYHRARGEAPKFHPTRQGATSNAPARHDRFYRINVDNARFETTQFVICVSLFASLCNNDVVWMLSTLYGTSTHRREVIIISNTWSID